MTHHSASARLDAVRARLAPVLADIAASAPARELDRSLPYDEVARLARAGFGAVRLPAELGGDGLDLAEFTELLIDLGTADANLPQLWRNHIAFVEDRLWHRSEPGADRWLRRIAEGAVIGGAWSERATVPGVWSTTVLDDTVEPAVVSGTKFYSTGSIFADWITVTARTAKDGQDVLVVVDARHPGVELRDDWNGMGQRLTGSGTTVLSAVPVEPADIYWDRGASPHQEIVYQLILVAALTGVTLAARDDAAAAVRARVRNYPQGLAARPADDAILQQAIGGVGAGAAAALATALAAGVALEAGFTALEAERDAAGDADGAEPVEGVPHALRDAAIATYEAQLVAADAALRAGTDLYDALGSSAVERHTGLDRHWRNARTLSSHNPRGYKARLLGDWYVNRADPSPWARRHDLPVPASPETTPEPAAASASALR